MSEKGKEGGRVLCKKSLQLSTALGKSWPGQWGLQRKDCPSEEWPDSVSHTVLSHWLGANQGEYGIGVDGVAGVWQSRRLPANHFFHTRFSFEGRSERHTSMTTIIHRNCGYNNNERKLPIFNIKQTNCRVYNLSNIGGGGGGGSFK